MFATQTLLMTTLFPLKPQDSFLQRLPGWTYLYPADTNYVETWLAGFTAGVIRPPADKVQRGWMGQSIAKGSYHIDIKSIAFFGERLPTYHVLTLSKTENIHPGGGLICSAFTMGSFDLGGKIMTLKQGIETEELVAALSLFDFAKWEEALPYGALVDM